MEKLENKALEIINKIKDKTNNNPEIVTKEITIFDTNICVVFDEMVADKTYIDRFVLRYLTEEKTNNNKYKNKPDDLVKYFRQTIPAHKITEITNYEDLFLNLFSGFSIFIIDGYNVALSLETRALLDSGIVETKREMTIKGPKDAFSENYQTNIGLIRKRLRTTNLRLEEQTVGIKSKTKVGIMYIDDIASKKLAKEIIEKIKNIKIDGVMDSSYIMETISEYKYKIFVDYLATERPDQVCIGLLDGKIAIVVENTPNVIIIPTVFNDFFDSPEDYYQRPVNVNFTKIVRFLAFFITILGPAIYVAILTYNIEAIPDNFLVSMVTQRQGVPFPTILETGLILVMFQIIREVDARTPNIVGSTLSIVGAIVLGQAAILAGIVSPATIIVVAFTAIAGMIVYSVDTVNGLRWWRWTFLFFSAIAGLLGVFVAGLFFIINLASMKSFGVPFLMPYAPSNKNDFNNSFFITGKKKYETRNSTINDKNIDRTDDKK